MCSLLFCVISLLIVFFFTDACVTVEFFGSVTYYSDLEARKKKKARPIMVNSYVQTIESGPLNESGQRTTSGENQTQPLTATNDKDKEHAQRRSNVNSAHDSSDTGHDEQHDIDEFGAGENGSVGSLGSQESLDAGSAASAQSSSRTPVSKHHKKGAAASKKKVPSHKSTPKHGATEGIAHDESSHTKSRVVSSSHSATVPIRRKGDDGIPPLMANEDLQLQTLSPLSTDRDGQVRFNLTVNTTDISNQMQQNAVSNIAGLDESELMNRFQRVLEFESGESERKAQMESEIRRRVRLALQAAANRDHTAFASALGTKSPSNISLERYGRYSTVLHVYKEIHHHRNSSFNNNVHLRLFTDEVTQHICVLILFHFIAQVRRSFSTLQRLRRDRILRNLSRPIVMQ